MERRKSRKKRKFEKGTLDDIVCDSKYVHTYMYVNNPLYNFIEKCKNEN